MPGALPVGRVMNPTSRMGRNPLFYLGMVIVISVVLLVQAGAFIQLQSLVYRGSDQNLMAVNTLFNYGNGTSRWANRSDVTAGSNFYELTVSLALAETTPKSITNQHFITALDGVRSAGRYYWTLWVYCLKDSAWAASKVGADLIVLANGDTLAWYYQDTNPATWQPPVEGARTVETCTA